MIDFTDYWAYCNHVISMYFRGSALAGIAMALGISLLLGMFDFSLRIKDCVRKSLGIIFLTGGVAGLVLVYALNPSTYLDDRINTVYGIQLAQAEDGACGNLHKLTRKPDNLICEVNYFKDNKPSSGKLIIQGNKVGLTDPQGNYLKKETE